IEPMKYGGQRHRVEGCVGKGHVFGVTNHVNNALSRFGVCDHFNEWIKSNDFLRDRGQCSTRQPGSATDVDRSIPGVCQSEVESDPLDHKWMKVRPRDGISMRC